MRLYAAVGNMHIPLAFTLSEVHHYFSSRGTAVGDYQQSGCARAARSPVPLRGGFQSLRRIVRPCALDGVHDGSPPGSFSPHPQYCSQATLGQLGTSSPMCTKPMERTPTYSGGIKATLTSPSTP